jgi:hypothetical protein
MKQEVNHSELFRLANRRAADLIAYDKRPATFRYNPVTRKNEPRTFKSRTITRAQALSQAFREMYTKYTVVVSVSAQEQLQRETSRREWDEIQNFQSHSVWNRGGRTND